MSKNVNYVATIVGRFISLLQKQTTYFLRVPDVVDWVRAFQISGYLLIKKIIKIIGQYLVPFPYKAMLLGEIYFCKYPLQRVTLLYTLYTLIQMEKLKRKRVLAEVVL